MTIGRTLTTALLGVVLSTLAAAQPYVAPESTPGSLLIFPLVDTSRGEITVVSITNTNINRRPIPGMTFREGDVDLRLRYAFTDGTTAESYANLGPGGVHSFAVDQHLEANRQGFLYVTARDPLTGDPIDFDFLLGSSVTFDLAAHSAFAIDARSFRAMTKENSIAGGLTPLGHVVSDVGRDGLVHLDGREYSAVHDRVTVPILFEEVPGVVATEVILLTTLPADYSVVVDTEVFNNDESQFATPFAFRVWTRKRFGEITGAALMPNLNGANPRGEVRTGWARLRAREAIHVITGKKISSPGVVGAFVTRAASAGLASAALLVGEGARDGGSLRMWQ